MSASVIGALALLLQAAQPLAGPPLSTPPAAAPDYKDAADWLCRPGKADDACHAPLDAVVVDATGARTPQPFVAAVDPKVDCFYVYPTVSQDPTDFSDLIPGPEEKATVRSQFARFGSKCRLFAPMYRQLTGAGLGAKLRAGTTDIDWSGPLADVKAAWRDYLARDNHGRGVILVGHSQGTILLTKLIAEEIEGKPIEKRIVAAYLAGHPGLHAREGAQAGEAFAGLPLCRSAAQTGCTVVFSTYLATDPVTRLAFGRDLTATRKAGCISPAAPGGGKATLKAYFSRPASAPATDPPFVEYASGLSAQCVSDAGGQVLRVSIDAGPNAAPLTAALSRPGLPGWGLHTYDMGLAMGDLIDETDAKVAAWTSRRR